MSLFNLFRKKFVTCVILAAGSSERMNGIDKLFESLSGMPVLAYSLLACENCRDINEIVVVTRPNTIESVMKICENYAPEKTSMVVAGGATRAASALEGVMAASAKASYIAIHDGARPLVTSELISRVVHLAINKGAAIPVIPVTDTVKTVSDGLVVSTYDRDTLRAAQTPQVFDAELIKAALASACEKGIAVTDDSQAVERLGMKVHVAEGDPDNIKLTLRRDFATAEAILAGRTEK